jgi:hypothetical protein
MKSVILMLAAACVLMAQGPEFNADGKLVRPNYREWIYLSSGLGMTYSAEAKSEPSFDNVFVSPPAYREFLATGRWPEQTMFVLEVRQASSHGSINQGGHFQSGVIAIEAEVKDSKKYPDKWAFFSFSDAFARMIPNGSACQTCHGKNGAVENTFVQFYPTLIETARKNGTLKASYQAPGPP